MRGNTTHRPETGWKSAYALVLVCAMTANTLPAQTFATLHDFGGTDGRLPESALVQGNDGNFYGTTLQGGASYDSTYDCIYGCGTVFRITPAGTLTTLHSFRGVDGAFPGGLIQASDGNFYGTTENGGTNNNCPLGCGTVFKITPAGMLTTLHSFCGNCQDGGLPSGLLQATDGNLYGTTRLFYGTVFKITPGGTLTTLHSFDHTDGETPSGLIQATDGNFYGATHVGGPTGSGTLFKITPAGTLTTLYSSGADALVQGTDGDFYGTASQSGANGVGSVFRLDVGFRPPGEPSLSGKIVYLAGPLTPSVVLTNTGTGEAKNIWINAVALRTLGGSGSVTLTAPLLPYSVGNLAAGASTAVPLSLTVPSTVTKFSITETGTVQDVSANTLNYSIGQAVLP